MEHTHLERELAHIAVSNRVMGKSFLFISHEKIHHMDECPTMLPSHNEWKEKSVAATCYQTRSISPSSSISTLPKQSVLWMERLTRVRYPSSCHYCCSIEGLDFFHGITHVLWHELLLGFNPFEVKPCVVVKNVPHTWQSNIDKNAKLLDLWRFPTSYLHSIVTWIVLSCSLWHNLFELWHI